MKRQWTVQDEINLCKWVDARGFKLVYLPQVEQWGFYHVDKPQEINGGFNKLVELKQHFVNLKGDNLNVQIVQAAELHQELERAGMLPVVH
jgi:hypothetical protein